MSAKTFRIGELAKWTHVPVDTIRYYEKLGLLAPAVRTRSGYRSF
ncbi:MAG TPA: MerR family DNA-binding transcriptional regulator, partial [Thermoanaerobaculia bacterium]